MSNIKVAKRYAKSAYQLAENKKLVDTFVKDFELIYYSLKDSRELQLLFRTPIIRKDKKIEITKMIFKKKIHNQTLEFIIFLISKNREVIFPDIFTSFLEIRNESLGIIDASITSFNPLSTDQQNKIKKKLEENTSKKIVLKTKVEKNLIGGLIIQVKDTVFDGSVKRKLELLKDHLSRSF